MADTTKSASATVSIVNPTTASVSVTVSPANTSVAGGQSQQFAATVTGTANTAVNWSVNGTPGGNATVGTISSEGYYTAPPCPAATTVQVTATSAYDGTTSASSSVALTSASNSNVRYVSVDGIDSNTGSACSPWATIQHAANSAQPGQTILVGDGTYPEQVTIMTSGNANGWITFKSVNKWGAKIAPTALSSYGWIVATGGGAIGYITIQDFDISGPDNSSYGVRVIGSNTQLIGNNIHHIGTATSCNSGGAISVSNGSNITIDGNVVSDVSPLRTSSSRCNHMHGMYLQGSNVTVTNNIVDQVWQGFGIQVAAGNVTNYMISNNTLFNNGDSRSSFGQSPTGGAFYYECYSGTTCANLTFQNNILMENTLAGYYCIFEAGGEGLVKNSVYRDNDTYNCGANIWATGSLTSNTNANPLLVNFLTDGTGDYHLLSSSPLIDQGAASGAPSVDFNGTPRPQGAGFDIGAFEYKDGIQ